MRYELENNQEEDCSLSYDNWWYLLSAIKFKDNSKRSVTHIKRLEISRTASNSESNESISIPRKKRLKTGVIISRKHQGVKTPKHHGIQTFCALYKKAGMHEQKFMSHSYENCFGNFSANSPSRKDWEEP